MLMCMSLSAHGVTFDFELSDPSDPGCIGGFEAPINFGDPALLLL